MSSAGRLAPVSSGSTRWQPAKARAEDGVCEIRSLLLDMRDRIDLEHRVVPISRAASSLAALIKRSRTYQQPIIIRQ
jgi:hypothetical protein